MDQPRSPEPPAVQADDLGKCYRIYPSPRARLMQAFWGNRRQLYREFWALQKISFSLPRGQTMGVVGRNGSGKSTLLQLLCSTLTPSCGSMQINGRVGALLELGSGFNPEFSGRENVFLNGAILGLSENEIEQRLDDILRFADIGDFIDQPVKTYSSGMSVRLAFAVQAHVDPDILVVDEALAVGDELFQRKCYDRLERLKQNGTSILLVTHSCPQIIQHCDQAMLLHRGRMRLLDEPQRVTALYQQLAQASEQEWDTVLPLASDQATAEEGGMTPGPTPDPKQEQEQEAEGAGSSSTRVIYPCRGAEILQISVETFGGEPTERVAWGEGFQLRFSYRADEPLSNLGCGCNIAAVSGQRITGQVAAVSTAEQQWQMLFRFRAGLLPGTYFVGGGIWQEPRSGQFLHRVVDYLSFRVIATTPLTPVGVCDLSDGATQLPSS